MGPYETQLRQTVGAQQDWDVSSSAGSWEQSASNLTQASHNLRAAADAMKEAFGGGSALGQAGHQAFTTSASHSDERAADMTKASKAVTTAQGAMDHGKKVATDLGSEPGKPPAYTDDPTASDQDRMRAQTAHTNAVNGYNAQMADREARSKSALDSMNTTFGHSTTTMESIHGQPDTVPAAAAAAAAGDGRRHGHAGVDRLPLRRPRRPDRRHRPHRGHRRHRPHR